MPLYDYRCHSCRYTFEAMANPEQHIIECPRCALPDAERVWIRFGGMLGRNKGVYPYFDKQLGVTLESSQHRDRVAKQRGLVVMGREEFDRSRHGPSTPDPLDDPNPDPKLIECAKKAWEDTKYHRVPREVAPPPDKESDFLDIFNSSKSTS